MIHRINVENDGRSSRVNGGVHVPETPRIGLALGSGGARGFAHIGVLQVLEEAKVPVHVISGSSMGSLIGAIYATGAPVKRIEQLACHLPVTQWIDVTLPRMGVIAGERFHRLIKLLTKELNFDQTVIPLSIIATDLETGERVTFTEGPIHEAVRASVAIPGVFTPYRYHGRILVDGGVIDRVPIQAARELGAEFVIAVDVGLFDKLPPVKNVVDVIVQSIDIMEREVFRYRVLDADFVVRPALDLMSSIAFNSAEKAIEVGRTAMQGALPQLLSLLDEWRGLHSQ